MVPTVPEPGMPEASARLGGRMAGPLTAVERFFERLFERPAARLFHVSVEPVQVQRAIERVMEAERRSLSGRVYVPNSFRVLLNRVDFDALATQHQEVVEDLAEAVRTYARAHGYVLPARPAITIDGSPVLSAGDVRVFAVSGSADNEPVSPGKQPVTPAAAAGATRNGERSRVPGGASASAGTSVFPVPQPNVPRAWLAARSPSQPVTRVVVRPGSMRIGRARDNDLVLLDDKVSRHHGQVAVRLGMLVYTDLGSTNGSFVNGAMVTEIALGPGDVLHVGNSTVTIEPGS